MAEPDETTDDPADEEVEETESEGTADDSSDQAEWKPPSKEEWEKTQKAMRRAKAEAIKHRQDLTKLKKEASDGSLNGSAAKQAEEQVRAAESRVVRSEALAAVVGSDFNGTRDQAKALLRLMDLDGVEPDGFGDYDFDDEIDRLKDLFPERFGKARPTVGRASTGRGRSDDSSSDDVDTRFAKRLLRQR